MQDGRHARFDMDLLVGYVLLTGVLLSMTLLAAGLVWHWATTGSLNVSYPIVARNLYYLMLSTVTGSMQAVSTSYRLINLGIAVLMLTPLVRVLASVFYFAFAERNGKYTIFTCFVLGVVVYALFFRPATEQ